MKMICEVPDEVIKCIKDGTWCGSSVAEKMIANGIPLNSSEEPCEDCISRQAVIEHICGINGLEGLESSNVFEKHYADFIKSLPSVKPKSEWEHDHEILKAYSDGANAVLDKIRDEIEHMIPCSKEALSMKLGVLEIIDKYKAEEDKHDKS